jgi:pimeloyl-ACP methyl ester carboxylesterase/DNA-binding CsgD family transcriptional regulator
MPFRKRKGHACGTLRGRPVEAILLDRPWWRVYGRNGQIGMSIPPVQYVTTPDACDIAYTVSGEGQSFVFLPTFLNHVQYIWDAYSFSSMMSALAGRFRLVNFDSRGMGMSTRGLPDTLSLDDYLCDLDSVVNHLQMDKFVLLGSCQSSFLGAHYAARYPERVSALILVNGAVSWDDWRLASVYDSLPREDWDLFLYNMVPQTRTPAESKRAVELMKGSMTQQDYLVSANVWQTAGLAPVLSRLHTPTLVLHSRDFRLRSVDAPIELTRRLPNGRLVLMESNLLFGEPGQAMDAITSFLQDIEQEASTLGMLLQEGTLSAHLTLREVQVLRLLAGGESNREIASRLVISLRTVERHISNIYGKISARGKADATAYAIRNL